MEQVDRFTEFVQVLPAFEWWRRAVDLVFLRYTGRSSYDLPISESAWRRFWTGGRPAQQVAEILSEFVIGLDRELAG